MDTSAPARPASLGTWLKKRAAPLIVFALLFAFWESAVSLTGIKEYLLPPPSTVWAEFLKRSDTVIAGAWVTTQEIIAGYLLAIVVSVPLALSVAYSRFIENAIYPVVVFLQIIPKIAIAPLFIIWFGFGFAPKLLPFGALDALTREQMRIDLEDLWMQTGKTVLFITHSIDEAVLLADRVIVMSPRPGRIEQMYDIALARPRGLAARSHPLFIAATQKISDLFLSKGILRGDAAHSA